MHKYAIPTCYFPSTVVFIDDSRDFLLNFTLQLDDNLAYRIFDSPFDALESITSKQRETEHLSQRCLTEYLDAQNWPMTNQTVNLNLAAIHSEVYNSQRFSEISVVVVDYAMPGMNGLEFCKRMENSSTRKILLTGQADERTAVSAFNEGIIHRYIKKNDPQVTELITESITQLQHHYFQNMSDMIIQMLAVNSPNCLQDEKFADFFKNLRQENNIVEFYLAESSGSFLMLDADANVSSLIMKNQQDLRMHYELALDNKAPQEILSVLKSGEKIPCFMHTDGIQTEWNDWSTCLLPAKKLEFNETYYYAYVKDPVLFDIRHEMIYPYRKYLENMET